MGIGTALDHPARILWITNLTDVTLLFSMDGVNDHWKLPSQGYILIDVAANQNSAQGLYIAEGTRIYVKQDGVPSTGSADVSVMYGSKD